MSEMTNEQIVSEFENLFGGTEEPEEEVQETPEDETPEEPEEEKPEEAEEQEESTEEETPAEDSKDKQQARQNHAFAEQRLQIKKQNDFIAKVGKLVGMDTANTDEILEKVNEALLEKQAKEQNVPVDLLKRIEAAEAVIQENNQIKLEKKVTDAFADLIDEHNLSQEEVTEFTDYLIEHDKNPMTNENIDLQAEYLKLHYKDMVQAAVDAALAKESDRKKKVDEKSASSLDPSPQEKDEKDITSVKELDDLFSSIDL